MFYNCSSIEKLNLNNFNTSKVIDMSYMFYNCKMLKILNISKFNTSNVINMTKMFGECKELNYLDISKFDIKKRTRINNMFYHCKISLKEKIRKQIKNINDNAFKDEEENTYNNYNYIHNRITPFINYINNFNYRPNSFFVSTPFRTNNYY